MSIQAAPVPAEAPNASGTAPARATGPEPRRIYWRGDLYDRLVAVGQFAGERVELVEGEILQTSPVDEPHAPSQYTTPPAATATARCACPGDGVAPLAAPRAVIAVNDLLP